MAKKQKRYRSWWWILIGLLIIAHSIYIYYSYRNLYKESTNSKDLEFMLKVIDDTKLFIILYFLAGACCIVAYGVRNIYVLLISLGLILGTLLMYPAYLGNPDDCIIAGGIVAFIFVCSLIHIAINNRRMRNYKQGKIYDYKTKKKYIGEPIIDDDEDDD